MKTYLFMVALFWAFSAADGQVLLSHGHVRKLNEVSSPSRRLLLYQKFYRRDSTLARKAELARETRQKAAWRSTLRGLFMRRPVSAIPPGPRRKTGQGDWSRAADWDRLRRLFADSTITDSVRVVLFRRLSGNLTGKGNSRGEWLALPEGDFFMQSMLPGRLPTFDPVEGGTATASPARRIERPPDGQCLRDTIGGLRKSLAGDVGEPAYQNEISAVQDRRSFREPTGLSDELTRRSEKLARALRKFRQFTLTDSGAASGAGLMKDRSFRERMTAGLSVQGFSASPIALAARVDVGYRLLPDLVFGMGIRQEFRTGDPIRDSGVRPGYRAAISCGLGRGYVLLGELGQDSFAFGRDSNRRTTDCVSGIGLGRRIPVSAWFNLNTMVVYNIWGRGDGRAFTNLHPLQLRLALELSQIATRAQRLRYHPNG